MGAGNVPAFRGLAYIVYPNRALSINQGLRHPNFQFEVYQQGVGDCFEQTEYSNDVLYPWFDTRNIYTFTPEALPGAVSYPTAAAAIAAGYAYTGVNQNVFIGYNTPPTNAGGATAAVVPLSTSVAIGAVASGVTVNPTLIEVHYNFRAPTAGIVETQASPPGSLYAIPGSLFWAPLNAGSDGNPGLVYVTSVPYASFAAYPPWDTPYQGGSRWSGFTWFETLQDLLIAQIRFPNQPENPCAGLLPAPGRPGYSLDLTGRLVKCNSWVLDTSTTYRVLRKFVPYANPDAYHTNYETISPLNPCLPITDPNYNVELWWTTAYTAAVAAGEMPSGLTYGVDYPLTQSHAWTLDSVVCEGSGFGVTVGSIIAAICKRSGLTAIDVTDMNGISIAGYAITAICTGSSIITPLRSVAFFDVAESNGVLKFLARGKPVVATLTTDDIGAYDATQATDPSKCPPSVITTRADPTTLPRQIRLSYVATSRDYGNGMQPSPFRLTTTSVNDVDITVPMCLGDVQAAQAAEVLWSDSWAASSAYEIAVDQAWLALDVGDCVGVPVDGVIERMRIVSDTNASAVLRKLSCVRDNGGAYISFAVAQTPQHQGQLLTFIGPTTAVLLDLPCLQDADSNPGFYVAARRTNYDGTLWHGCVIYKSSDGGATFTDEASITGEAMMGIVGAAVPVSDAYTWDTVTVIAVTVPSSTVTFESITDAAVLAGGNEAAMGMDGRWEIVQFATATQVDATHWHLSRLLRGRRGTEHVMGTSMAGDDFVLLSTAALGRIVLDVAEIGAARIYKTVSMGASYGVDQPFTDHGEALVCFSPVDLAAHRLSDGDVLISWIRRSRLGRTLMDGVDIPLGEATESFQVDIIEAASPHAVLRTLSSATTSVLYSHANQESDFGSPLPTMIHVEIYQLSAITGRGTPAVETLVIT
jgi:hypothetical protein